MLESLIIAAITGAGLIGGLLFVFSNCVMKSLSSMPGSEGMRAMQLINRDIQNPVFLLFFAGTTVISVAIVIVAALQQPPGFGFAIAGAVCYIIGPFGMTATCNVPLNNRLDQADLESEEGLALWAFYLKRWTMWNHIRVVISILSVILLALGLSGSH